MGSPWFVDFYQRADPNSPAQLVTRREFETEELAQQAVQEWLSASPQTREVQQGPILLQGDEAGEFLTQRVS